MSVKSVSTRIVLYHDVVSTYIGSFYIYPSCSCSMVILDIIPHIHYDPIGCCKDRFSKSQIVFWSV